LHLDKKLFNSFIESYPDWSKLKQRTFTTWVEKFARFKEIPFSDRRSSGKDYFVFGEKKEENSEQNSLNFTENTLNLDENSTQNGQDYHQNGVDSDQNNPSLDEYYPIKVTPIQSDFHFDEPEENDRDDLPF